MNNDIKFYIEHCLTYMALGKNALRLYCKEKDKSQKLKVILDNISYLKTKIAKMHSIQEPDNDLHKVCIKCAIQRLNEGRLSLKKVVELDNIAQPILEEYNNILESLVNYLLEEKNEK